MKKKELKANVKIGKSPAKPLNPETLPLGLTGERIMFVKDGDTWGCWTFYANNLTLVYYRDGLTYEIDLRRCRTAFGILDWISQLKNKTWADNNCLGNLVRAFDDIFHPQQNNAFRRDEEIDTAVYFSNILRR